MITFTAMIYIQFYLYPQFKYVNFIYQSSFVLKLLLFLFVLCFVMFYFIFCLFVCFLIFWLIFNISSADHMHVCEVENYFLAPNLIFVKR